jgi:hypothetical protein
MIYTSARGAIVSALASEAIDNTSTQAWQKLYRAGYPDSHDLATLSRSRNSGLTRMDVDCWVYARLHSALKPRHWNSLVARYSTHREKKRGSIETLIPIIATPAPRQFLGMAVYTWAIPRLAGVDGKRSTDMIVLADWYYDMNNWQGGDRPERTLRRWRADIRRVLDEMCGEAERHAEELLVVEGLLLREAA